MKENFKARFLRKKFLIIAGFIFTVVIFITGFILINFFGHKNTYQKPKAWTISQNIYSTLAKQKLLSDFAGDGELTVAEIARVATSSATLKQEVVKVGDKYLLSTGSDGQVKVSLPIGIYTMAVMPIPNMDFTGVPDRVRVEGSAQIMTLGLKGGSGKVFSKALPVITRQSLEELNSTDFLINLFHDKNGDGIKQAGEVMLPWAGVTFRLIPI